MPYYHVFIEYTDKEGQEQYQISYNRSEEYVREQIAIPYMKNKKFVYGGKVIQPTNINHIAIFRSEKGFNSLILPNGKHPVGQDKKYIRKCFYMNKVEEVEVCTSDFVTSPPQEREKPTKTVKPIGEKNKMFIVHGRDDKQALRLQKYLKDKLKVDAVMFDDLPDKGRTIIEQLEYIRDNVGYAFVIATPDDVGCLTEDIEKLSRMLASYKSVKGQTVAKIFEMLHTRARQNVVFEFGLFMGALGRKRVCCLVKQDTEERPSDIDGILYKLFNKSVSEIFHEIPEELTEAGYEIKM